MENLSNELICDVFKLLDYRDLLRVGVCCKRFQRIMKEEFVWAEECRKWWNLTDKPDPLKSWYETFEAFYKDFGRYIDCYKPIRVIWDQIFALTRQRTPRVYQSLLPGVTEELLDKCERKLNVRFPLDYRCSYRICNGQTPASSGNDLIYGLFGVDRYQDIGSWFLWSLFVEEDRLQGYYWEDGFYFIPVTHYNWDNWDHLPLPNYGNEHIRHCIILNKLDVSTNAAFPDCVEKGVRIPGLQPVFVIMDWWLPLTIGVVTAQIAGSFLEYLRKQLNYMEKWPVQDGYLLRFLPNNSEKTGPFRVDVAVHDDFPLGEYGYRITISMDANASSSDSCQLETRHWEIIDSKGMREVVSGRGVVGEFPVIRPGSSHSWISKTSFKTLSGHMNGHFMMKNLETGLPVRIECATMTFKPDTEKLVWIELKDGEMEIEEAPISCEGSGSLVSVKNKKFRKWLKEKW